MSFDFDAPEEAPSAGGNYLDKPGRYHCGVVDLKEGQGPRGNPIDGFTLLFTVFAGTDDEATGKSHSETFFSPNISAKDGGKFSRQQLFSLFVALGMARPDQLGKQLDLNLADAVNRQLIIDLEVDSYAKEKRPDGPTFLRLKGCNVFHPDDPRCENAVTDSDTLAAIPAEQRHTPEYFAPLTAKRQKIGTAGSSIDVSDL